MIFTLPPTISDDAADRQGRKGEVDDSLIQGFGGPFAQLLCRTGTDRTLGIRRGRSGKKKAQGQYNQPVLFYKEILILRMIHNSGVESQKYDY
jgi:hypothetical protein